MDGSLTRHRLHFHDVVTSLARPESGVLREWFGWRDFTISPRVSGRHQPGQQVARVELCGVGPASGFTGMAEHPFPIDADCLYISLGAVV